MKKCTAIFLLFLICLTGLTGKLHVGESGYGWFAESDEAESENKETKKEVKEFTSSAHKKLSVVLLVQRSYHPGGPFTLPDPALDKPTPPPDSSC